MLAILKRLCGAAIVLVGALTLVFFVLYWLPGDPASIMMGDDAPPELIDKLSAELGTDKPLWVQYLSYAKRLSTGDLGTSYVTGEPVVSRLLAQFPATLALTTAATLTSALLGMLLGVVSAVHVGDWVDRTIQTVILFLTSMPTFWIGILLVLLFSLKLQWLPAIGNGSVQQLILPVACLGIGGSARVARMVRNNVIEVIQEPFVTALRGKGLLEHVIIYGHVLRNALIPVVTMLGMLTADMLGGTVIIETLFARQGLGRLIQESINSKDIPMVQGAVLLAAGFYIVINALVDQSYRWIDRRVEV